MPPKAAEAFYKSESRYRTLVENSCDIIFSFDLEGRFTFVSPAWKTVLGHDPADVVGHNFREFIHPEDVPPCETAVATAIQGDRALEVTYRIRHDDGKWRWHRSRGVPHRDDDDVLTIIGIAHDVTERLRIEEMMALTEKMIMVSGLAAGMAHEINNPLGAIMQHAQNIERRVSGDFAANRKAADEVGVSLDLVRSYLEKRGIFAFIGHIRSAGIRASEIILQMLRFSNRSETGIVNADMSVVLERVAELAATDYDMKKKYAFRTIEIVREYAAEPVCADIALQEMEQVLLNILKNAAQAMFGAKMVQRPRIILRTELSRGMAVLEIEDNGPGMDEATRMRIFEPFFTTKEIGVGTGLGLSVAYAIVTKGHHGTIEVRSQPGEGSCFVITLPVQGKEL
ncbi:MAG: PAS domain S-box protein [Pelobacteraceae bacterium]